MPDLGGLYLGCERCRQRKITVYLYFIRSAQVTDIDINLITVRS